MDNQKFRVNLTIYHTNGGVMSPTTIVFSGARREGLSKALALLFQFTPLREGRPLPSWYRPRATNFNSRPCVRGDSKIRQNRL